MYSPLTSATADGQPIRRESDKKAIYEVVRAHLMGTATQQKTLAAVAGGGGGGASASSLYAAGGSGGALGSGVSKGKGSEPSFALSSGAIQFGNGGGDSGGAGGGGGLADSAQHQTLLRALSGKWKFGG